MAEAHIELNDVRKAFGSKPVLNGVDIAVQRGQSLVVIGGSGTGKSVMLKCILGIIHPDSGSIRIGGEEVVGLSGSQRDKVLSRFGMLFQGAALFDSLSVWQNVAFGLIQGKKMRRREAKEIAITKLGQVGLGAEVGELYPAELSGGMQKRVGLARAIAADPEIIFFDEPTTGLDPIMADIINDLIVDCVKRPVASLNGAGPHGGTVELTDPQIARLEAVFPEGVCDWSQPGTGQVPLAGTWHSY